MATYRTSVCDGNTKKNSKAEKWISGCYLNSNFHRVYTTAEIPPEKKNTLSQTFIISKNVLPGAAKVVIHYEAACFYMHTHNQPSDYFKSKLFIHHSPLLPQISTHKIHYYMISSLEVTT